jgi:UDP-N-acetylglucosamine:LPS N-acetylglucosamine transferase
MKICIVSSAGGHLDEIRCLRPAYGPFEHFYVINQPTEMTSDMRGRTYFISHSERDLLFLKNLVEAWSILRRERPDVLISSGAGAIVPFSIVGRLFFGTEVIFVECLARVVKPSLSGRIMHWLATRFYYQSETLAPFFPRGEYRGVLL